MSELRWGRIIVVLAIVIVGVFAFLKLGGGGGSADVTTTLEERRAVVAVDGWSVKTAGTTAASIKFTRTPQSLNFQPATLGDIKAILAEEPDKVRNLVARIVTSDPSLDCNNKGCSTTSGKIDLEDLVNPQNIKGLGELYKDWGVTSGVYLASVPDVPAGQTVSFTFAGVTSAYTFPGAAISDDNNPADPLGGPSAPPISRPTAVFGYAFGRVFPLEAQWGRYEDNTQRAQVPGQLLGTDLNRIPDTDFGPTSPLASGLNSKTGIVSKLTNSQLTSFSSPTTGCFIGVSCLPTAGFDVTPNAEPEKFLACSANGSPGRPLTEIITARAAGTPVAPLPVAVVLRDETWKGNLDKATHLVGAWNGKSAPAGALANLYYPDAPPLVKGEVELRVRTAELYILPRGDAAPVLFDIVGSVAQVGKDSDEAVNRAFTKDVAYEVGKLADCTPEQAAEEALGPPPPSQSDIEEYLNRDGGPVQGPLVPPPVVDSDEPWTGDDIPAPIPQELIDGYQPAPVLTP